jgi:manganese transport protein
MQLPFAVFPLVLFTSSRKKMGVFANPLWLKIVAFGIATIIGSLNVWLIFNIFS